MSNATLPGKSIGSLLGADPVPPAAQRLSESVLWDRQREFYGREAAGLWGTATVPHSITGNPRIAHTYARLAAEFLRSVDPPGSAAPASPVATSTSPDHDVPHFVEFGGGSGRFAYLFVRHLRELAPGRRFTYVLTDFSADRVAGWAAHPSYRPFVEQGLLDFAVLDADDLGPIRLQVSGRTLSPGTLRAPVIGIANYVFDTLRHEGYLVRGGELLECRVAAADGTGDVRWDAAPCGTVPEDLAPILQHYRENLDDTAVLVPVGGLRCLDFLDALTTGPTCALVADKGHCTPVELCSHEAPSVVMHGGGFSLMVNFDLLARYTRQRGGAPILPREPARSLVVGAFVRGTMADPRLFATWVQDQLLDIGPDNYFAVRPLLGAAGGPSLETMLASLRLSRFDPALLIELLPGLLDALPAAPDSMRVEVERVLLRVWDNHFPIGEPIDMALCVGLAFSAMDRFARAVDFLELSVKEHPDSPPAAFSMGVARRGLRDLHAALEWTQRALELDPGFAQARALRAVLIDELGDGWVV